MTMTLGVAIAFAAALARAEPLETVDTIKVLTDKYVDTTSLDGIVQGIAKPRMSDQEKLIAFYDWYRRVIFHHRYMGPDRRNVLRSINSYGCNLCGSQAAVLAVLLKRAGFEVRVVAADGGTGFGAHTMVEVRYGGAWHCIDTMTGFFVLNRDDPPKIASLAEIQRDPSLVAAAARENRAPAGFLCCMKDPDITSRDIARLEKMGVKADRRWATFTFEGGSLLDFWTKAPRSWRSLTTGAYGGHYEPGVLDIVLKPNEEYVRLWDNVGKWLKGPSYACHGPHHTCGRADEHDKANFRYFEPYRKDGVGLTGACYRYFGNGWLEWRPSPAEARAAAEQGTVDNLVCAGAYLRRQHPSRAGVLEIPVKSPYAVVEIEAEIESEGGEIPAVSFRIAGDEQRPPALRTGAGTLRFVHREERRPVYVYTLRVIHGGDIGFRLVRLKTTFQLNIYSLPGFFPGTNTVTVAAKAPESLGRSKLLVTYEWDEGPGWGIQKRRTEEITSFPTSYEVEVAGPKMPRMKRLAIRLVSQ
jgi:hypothetical protein